MASDEDKNPPITLQEQKRAEEARDLAGLRPGIAENLGQLANPEKSVLARYDHLRARPEFVEQQVLKAQPRLERLLRGRPQLVKEQFLLAKRRRERLDSDNPHHQIKICRIEADIELYRRIAREGGFPLDVRDEMLLLDEALHQRGACDVSSIPAMETATLQTGPATPPGGGNLPQGTGKGAMPNQPNESIQLSYDPAWNLRGCGDEPETVGGSFRRLARRAVAALSKRFTDPAEAVDFWLNLVYGFHAGQRISRYASDHWRLKHVFEASAEYCAEQRTRAHEAGDSKAENTWAELENEFRASSNSDAELSAITRRDTHLHRDRYPFGYWLYDHSHEPMPDVKAELDYWKAHVRQGYDALIAHCAALDRKEQMDESSVDLKAMTREELLAYMDRPRPWTKPQCGGGKA
jgi:hypothetical protein